MQNWLQQQQHSFVSFCCRCPLRLHKTRQSWSVNAEIEEKNKKFINEIKGLESGCFGGATKVMGLVGFAWFGCLTCCDCRRKTIWKLQRYHIHKKKHGCMFGDKQSFLARRDLPRALVYVLIQSCGTKMTWIVCHVPALAWRVWECNGCAVIQNAVFVFLLISFSPTFERNIQKRQCGFPSARHKHVYWHWHQEIRDILNQHGHVSKQGTPMICWNYF